MEDRKSKRYMTAVYRYAFSRLVLHYTLYCETAEERQAVSQKEQSIEKEFDRLLKGFLLGEGTVEELDRLRGQIKDRTEVLTAYSDCFHIYEYVLNRLERRFVKMPASTYTPRRIAGELTYLLAGIEQSGDRNNRLREILFHLPVRLTRQKFYSMVTERFTVYAGLNRDSVEDFLYMLKTSAMVRLPDNMEEEKELYQVLTLLRSADYRSLDKEGFDSCQGEFSAAVRLLTEKIDFYVAVQEMVNELYMLKLTENKKLVEAGEESAFRAGLTKLLTASETGEDLSDQEKEEILVKMEGIQEAVENVVMSGNPKTDPVLRKLDKLVSGSAFMSLEEKEISGEVADNEWMEQQARIFCQELDGLLSGLPKPVARAVMATVLSNLPVMFKDSLEIEEYICASLESCTDLAEREACLELLEQELMDADVVV